MSKQSIIAITICVIMCGAFAQNTTNIVTPSAAAQTATSQQKASDTNVQTASANVKTVQGQVAANQTSQATALGAMNTENYKMTQLVTAAATARMALASQRAKARAALATSAAATLSNSLAVGQKTCATGLQAWGVKVNGKVRKVGSTTTVIDLTDSAAAYQTARTAMTVPTSFGGLLNNLNTRITALEDRLTARTNQVLGVMKAGCVATAWTAFKNTNYATITTINGNQCVDQTANSGLNKLKAGCITGQTRVNAQEATCGFTALGAWQPKMVTLLTDKGPKWNLVKGQRSGATQLQTWLAKAGNTLTTFYTSDVKDKLGAGITALTNLMNAYSAQATILENALTAAVSDVNAAVTLDTTATTGKTAVAAKAVTDNQNTLNAANTAVTNYVGADGLWGKAKAAVGTARAAVVSQRTALGGLVAAQWSAQVKLQNAQVVNGVSTQRNTDATALNTNLGLVLSGWQTNDGSVNTVLSASKAALAKQENATLYLINPPKPTRF